MEIVKIPKERIAVLIGEKGRTKRQVEKETQTKLNIDSKEGTVTIDGEDSYKVYLTVHIIKAIARGFNPDRALNLLNEGYGFEIIVITDVVGKSKNTVQRQKARLIGTKGKARTTLETLTDTEIVVYGKTVCIIGETLNVILAKQAIERLLQGAKHGNVYVWIEKQKEQEPT